MSSTSALNSLVSSSSTSSTSSLDISSLLAAATGATSTGIDVTSAVDAAIYAAQAPERQWQAEQATVQSQITALTSIQTSAATLSADLDNLNDMTGSLAARSAVSSNSSALTATAAPGTAVGRHTVNITNLATSASWYSSVVASSSASLGSSVLTITNASGSQTSFGLGTSGSSSLTSVAASINAAKLGITASVVQDASGSRLALVGASTGANANFTVTDGSSTSQIWSSVSLPGASTTLSASNLQVGDGSSSATINVAAGSTLADVANQINAQGLNVTASVVSDDSGAHLSVSSNSGGNVTVSSDPALVLTQPTQAADASLTVDGIPVSSASNTVTGVLSGITLNLTGNTAGNQVTLNVGADTTQINSVVSQFVTDYNSALSLVSSQFTYSSTTGSQGVLGSDASMRTLQSMLLGISTYSTAAGGTSPSTITTLSALGVTMNDDGSLSLDTGTLDQAVQQDPSSVQTFFQGNAQNGFACAIQTSLKTFTNSAVGTLAVGIHSLTQQYNDLQSDVDNFESGYIASQKTLLTSMYSKAETALQSLPTTLKQLQAELGNNSGS